MALQQPFVEPEGVLMTEADYLAMEPPENVMVATNLTRDSFKKGRSW